VRFFSVHRQLPIGSQFILMQLCPRLNEPQLPARQVPQYQFQRVDGERRLELVLVRMEVRRAVLTRRVVHPNDDPVEHRDGGHRAGPRRLFRFRCRESRIVAEMDEGDMTRNNQINEILIPFVHAGDPPLADEWCRCLNLYLPANE
jgi:hypothetical protein